MNSAAFKYNTWRDIYTNFETNSYDKFKGRVIGGETCMWSEVNNPETTLNKIWIRSSALAERLWNPNANSS
jgi:hexosaminidase